MAKDYAPGNTTGFKDEKAAARKLAAILEGEG